MIDPKWSLSRMLDRCGPDDAHGPPGTTYCVVSCQRCAAVRHGYVPRTGRSIGRNLGADVAAALVRLGWRPVDAEQLKLGYLCRQCAANVPRPAAGRPVS